MFRLGAALLIASTATAGEVTRYFDDFEDGAIDQPLVESKFIQELQGSFAQFSELSIEPRDGQLSMRGTGTRDAIPLGGGYVGWIGRCVYLPVDISQPVAMAIEADVEIRTARLSRGGSDSGYMAGLCLESGPGDRINFFLIENIAGPIAQMGIADEDGFHLAGTSFAIATGRTYRLRLELDVEANVARGLVDGVLKLERPFNGNGLIRRAGVTATVRTNGDVLDARFDNLAVLQEELPFQRGDVNRDHLADLSDAVRMLECMFLDGPCASCLDAADSNDDGALDVSDPIHLLRFQFLGGPALPGPVDDCGLDPTEDLLPSCVSDAC